jgi:alpha-D-ribose 1-methylphosphonate 5-triphosphate synthase subunit PhnH
MNAITSLAPGFVDPARDSQSVFRQILNATAYAGRIETVDLPIAPPAGLSVAAGVAALTLLDMDVDLWLSASLRDGLTPWLRFHCGCPVVAGDRLDAAFALLARGDECPPLDTARLDDPERPDISTTLIVECEALSGGRPLRATGPGIKDEILIAPLGLPGGLLEERNALRSLLPLGVDLYLTAGSQIMALPRTTRIEEMD